MSGYYSEKLSGERLKKVYDVAPQRVKQYLAAEIDFALSIISAGDRVLELGCGYGRVLRPLSGKARFVVGIDNAPANLDYATEFLRDCSNVALACMDAAHLALKDEAFDTVLCVQNGLSAFRLDPRVVVGEALRVCRPHGKLALSTYSPNFWQDRLDWFCIQSEHGLVGEVNWGETRDGTIVCHDGFRATTTREADFCRLAEDFNLNCAIFEVDSSSIFCVLSQK